MARLRHPVGDCECPLIGVNRKQLDGSHYHTERSGFGISMISRATRLFPAADCPKPIPKIAIGLAQER